LLSFSAPEKRKIKANQKALHKLLRVPDQQQGKFNIKKLYFNFLEIHCQERNLWLQFQKGSNRLFISHF